jgi:hypothetical protein
LNGDPVRQPTITHRLDSIHQLLLILVRYHLVDLAIIAQAVSNYIEFMGGSMTVHVGRLLLDAPKDGWRLRSSELDQLASSKRDANKTTLSRTVQQAPEVEEGSYLATPSPGRHLTARSRGIGDVWQANSQGVNER